MKNTFIKISKICLLMLMNLYSSHNLFAQSEIFSEIEVRDGRLYFPNEEVVQEVYKTLEEQLNVFEKEKREDIKKEDNEEEFEFVDDITPLKQFEENFKSFTSFRTHNGRLRYEINERGGDPVKELKHTRVDDIIATFLNADQEFQIDDYVIALTDQNIKIKVNIKNADIIRKIREYGNIYEFGSDVVEVLNPPCNADFTFSGNTNSNSTVTFVYSGNNVTGQTYLWTFGDGTTSTDQNPTHQFSTNGTYTVMLKVTNGETSCTSTKQVVINTGDCNASFTYSGNTTGLSVSFTYSGNVTSSYNPIFQWDFGDGGTSNVKNPSHTYTSAGDYNVQLTVTVNGKTCTTKATISVNHNCKAKFKWQASQPQGNICFTDQSTTNSGTITSWEWQFGDTGTGNIANPCHVYTCDAQQNVTLKIKTSTGCESSVTNAISVSAFACCDPDPGAKGYMYSSDKNHRVEYEMYHEEPFFSWNNYRIVTKIWYDKKNSNGKYKNAKGKLEITTSGTVYTADGSSCTCKIPQSADAYDIDHHGHILTLKHYIVNEEIKAKNGEPWDAAISLNGTQLGVKKVNVGCN